MADEKRLIDANALREEVKKNNKQNFFNKDWSSEDVCILLKLAPTVDAVEVVRCKDCKWYEANCETCVLRSDDGDTYDFGYEVDMKPDDFCSYGERRNDVKATD